MWVDLSNTEAAAHESASARSCTYTMHITKARTQYPMTNALELDRSTCQIPLTFFSIFKCCSCVTVPILYTYYKVYKYSYTYTCSSNKTFFFFFMLGPNQLGPWNFLSSEHF